jgi:hypothetical protein
MQDHGLWCKKIEYAKDLATPTKRRVLLKENSRHKLWEIKFLAEERNSSAGVC